MIAAVNPWRRRMRGYRRTRRIHVRVSRDQRTLSGNQSDGPAAESDPCSAYPATLRRELSDNRKAGNNFAVTPILILAGLITAIVLFRQVRWLAMITLLITLGYFVHGFFYDQPHEARRDRITILRP
jgi:hypothetical protein